MQAADLRAVEKQHTRGKLTARERIDYETISELIPSTKSTVMESQLSQARRCTAYVLTNRLKHA